jgi:hypothetical protein
MPEISIDHLTLELPGMPESEGRRLASRIGDGLASMDMTGLRGDIPSLRIDLTAGNASGTSELARHIVQEIQRQLRQSP